MHKSAERIPLTGSQAIARIQSALTSLVSSERRVAEVILANPRDVIGKTATQLGSEAGTSATTVIRFARSVGFGGYTELVMSLAISERDLEPPEELPDVTDQPAAVLEKVARVGARMIASIADSVEVGAFEGAVRTIAGARHTLCLGATLTVPVATDLAYRLNHLGLSADAPLDSQVQRIRAKGLGEQDVCVAILHGGSYPRVVDAARDAAREGATVVAITSFVRTPLAELADLPLIVGGNQASVGLHAWPARLAYMALVDALVLAVHNTDSAKHDASLESISDLIQQDLL